jgi:hypothetical protein
MRRLAELNEMIATGVKLDKIIIRHCDTHECCMTDNKSKVIDEILQAVTGLDPKVIDRLSKATNKLIGKVNRVTSSHRHGLKVRDKDLTDLSNYQIDIEDILRDLGLYGI